MKNKKKYCIIIFVLLLVFIMVSLFRFVLLEYSPTYLGTRIYQGPRVVVTLHINVDGEPAFVADNDARLNNLTKDGDNYIFKHRANSYEVYNYSFKINEQYQLHLHYQHFNWWEILRSDVYLDIDTESETYTIYEQYYYTSEDPVYHIEHCSNEKRTENGIDIIDEYFGN